MTIPGFLRSKPSARLSDAELDIVSGSVCVRNRADTGQCQILMHLESRPLVSTVGLVLQRARPGQAGRSERAIRAGTDVDAPTGLS